MLSPKSLTVPDFSAPPKVTRSFSISSSLSSGSGSSAYSGTSASSAYSRSADDMLDRLAALDSTATVHLWSAGNVRFNGRDLTIPSQDAAELIEAMKVDERFEVTDLVHLGGGEDWKVSFRRTTAVSLTTNGDKGERCPAI
ncbi:hypothetical protein BCR39DRAFT_556079 [Naematelia encephala]|uniref:Uncharacterized protein n=1 Tax=Naematelia encephala TaxID=71784 RepID=A0A1Y2BIE4_9TREE|nr:hypothetical protein BCR39DRAFT_556079 [Naematelia encephala]